MISRMSISVDIKYWMKHKHCPSGTGPTQSLLSKAILHNIPGFVFFHTILTSVKFPSVLSIRTAVISDGKRVCHSASLFSCCLSRFFVVLYGSSLLHAKRLYRLEFSSTKKVSLYRFKPVQKLWYQIEVCSYWALLRWPDISWRVSHSRTISRITADVSSLSQIFGLSTEPSHTARAYFNVPFFTVRVRNYPRLEVQAANLYINGPKSSDIFYLSCLVGNFVIRAEEKANASVILVFPWKCCVSWQDEGITGKLQISKSRINQYWDLFSKNLLT